MLKKVKLLFFLFIPCILLGQQIEYFSSGNHSAKPYGGLKEIENLFKQELIYPEKELNNKIGGSVFIEFKVDGNGKVVEQRVINSENDNLKEEAVRIFNKILWMADDTRNIEQNDYEKIQFIFFPQKYKRVIKKRGYSELPLQNNSENLSDYFNLSQLDEAPELENGEKIGNYVSRNIKYPSIAFERGLSGKVSVEFIIEPYGKVSNVRIVKAQGGGFNGETIRLIRSINWQAGIKDGKAVRTLYQYELSFIHPGGVVK